MATREARRSLRTFRGATAVVTGGASGIGRALGKALTARGAEVVLADRQTEEAEAVAAEIRAGGGKAQAAPLDVRDFEVFRALVEATAARTGRLDYLFNNAGILISGDIEDFRLEDWYETLDVNLRGVIHGVQAAWPVMAAQGFGHLVNTASVAGLTPVPGSVAYAASKHAVVGLSISLHAEAAAAGIRVSVLCPGFVRTPIFEQGGKFGRILMEISPEQQRRIDTFIDRYRPLAPEVFAKRALNRVATGEAVIVVPGWWKWLWRLQSFFPGVMVSRTAKVFVENREKLGLY